MDIVGDCCKVGVVVMMVTAVARVAALIRIDLFSLRVRWWYLWYLLYLWWYFLCS